jgi:type II secretory pathway pseudopilin PulG
MKTGSGAFFVRDRGERQCADVAAAQKRLPTPFGFTLLEILLSIALSVLVLGIVGAAMYFQLQVVETSRSEVEQAQLARAVMQYIADDLRNVIRYEPLDAAASVPGGSGASGMGGDSAGGTEGGSTDGGTTGGSAKTGGSSGGSASGGGAANQTGSNASSQASNSGGASGAPDSPESDALAAETTPGLRGDPYWMKIDVSRLPRRDQLLGADAAFSRISDMKTVEYFVIDPTAGPNAFGGLKRREVSRAESLMAIQQGTGSALAQVHDRMLAPEVLDVRFSYHDGQMWYDNWPPEEAIDQQTAAKLPVAVQVILTLRPHYLSENVAGDAASMTGYPQRRLIVHVPSALPFSEQEAASAAAPADATGQSSGGTGAKSATNANSASGAKQ